MQVRASILDKRKRLSAEEVNTASQQICARVMALRTFQRAQCVLLYMAIEQEVQLTDLYYASLLSSKRIAMPVCQGSEMRAYEIEHLSQLKPGAFHIPEPDVHICKPVLPEELDCILVPGVAFDQLCHRLGRGGGYYDRFLPLTPQATKIGIGYSFQILPDIPTDGRDFPMDYIVHENGLFSKEAQE